MSSEDFSKRSDRVRKDLNTLRKDINYRDEQEQRGEATYALDAEINGQFSQINEALKDIETMVNNFRNNYKDYNLTISEANKRYRSYEQLCNERNTLKRSYDALFQKKTEQRQLLVNNSDKDIFEKKYNTTNMTTKDLNALRAKQEQEQEDVLQELINNVRTLKGGQQNVGNELTDQQKLLETLDQKMDGNIDKMSSTRRRVVKLLESSSNCCLITAIIVEIALIIIVWVLIG